MTVGEMVNSLRTPVTIELRDEENYNICFVKSDSKGIERYKNYEVVDWFPVKHVSQAFIAYDLVFRIKENNKEVKE